MINWLHNSMVLRKGTSFSKASKQSMQAELTTHLSSAVFSKLTFGRAAEAVLAGFGSAHKARVTVTQQTGVSTSRCAESLTYGVRYSNARGSVDEPCVRCRHTMT